MNIVTLLLKSLSNPKVQKALLIIALLLILLWFLNRGSSDFRRWFRSNVAPVKGENVNAPLSDNRKTFVEDLGDQILSEVNGFWGNSDLEDSINIAYGLPDNELFYLARYYEKINDGETLYYDVDWEVMAYTDADDKLIARLNSMNLI